MSTTELTGTITTVVELHPQGKEGITLLVEGKDFSEKYIRCTSKSYCERNDSSLQAKYVSEKEFTKIITGLLHVAKISDVKLLAGVPAKIIQSANSPYNELAIIE